MVCGMCGSDATSTKLAAPPPLAALSCAHGWAPQGRAKRFVHREVRQCAKPALAPLPANKNDIVEWRELVYGRDGIVGDIIAQEALLEDADLFEVPDAKAEASETVESQAEAHHAWDHTKAVIKAGAFEKGGMYYTERATIHLDTNVDPSRMSNFARQEFIDEVAAELGVEPSQVKLRT